MSSKRKRDSSKGEDVIVSHGGLVYVDDVPIPIDEYVRTNKKRRAIAEPKGTTFSVPMLAPLPEKPTYQFAKLLSQINKRIEEKEAEEAEAKTKAKAKGGMVDIIKTVLARQILGGRTPSFNLVFVFMDKNKIERKDLREFAVNIFAVAEKDPEVFQAIKDELAFFFIPLCATVSSTIIGAFFDNYPKGLKNKELSSLLLDYHLIDC